MKMADESPRLWTASESRERLFETRPPTRDREVQRRCPEQFAPLHVGPVVVMVRMTVAVRVITVVIVFVVRMCMHNVDLFLMWIRVDKDK